MTSDGYKNPDPEHVQAEQSHAMYWADPAKIRQQLELRDNRKLEVIRTARLVFEEISRRQITPPFLTIEERDLFNKAVEVLHQHMTTEVTLDA